MMPVDGADASTSVLSPNQRPGSAPRNRWVECIVCHVTICQKSIKAHFVKQHPDRDYEDQKTVHTAKLRQMKSSPSAPFLRQKSLSCSSIPKLKNLNIKKEPKESTTQSEITSPERPDVLVACVICYDLFSMKSMKGHFLRVHPEYHYDTLKSSMSSASPTKKSDVQCVACNQSVSLRTLKVHILKNHPDLDYGTVLRNSREGNPSAVLVKKANFAIQSTESPGPSVQRSTDSDSVSSDRTTVHTCVVCQKPVIWLNMRKHFRRKHSKDLDKYEQMKEKRKADLRLEKFDKIAAKIPVVTPTELQYDRLDRGLRPAKMEAVDEVQKDVVKDVADLDEEVMKEMALDPFSRDLAERLGIEIQISETMFCVGETQFPKGTPMPETSMNVEGTSSNVIDFVQGKNSIKKENADIASVENEIRTRLATENYFLYLKEYEEFMARKMLAFQTVMEKRMKEFEERVKSDFRERLRFMEGEFEKREKRMKEKMEEQDRWFLRRLEEQRRLVNGDVTSLTVALPSPSTSDDSAEKCSDSSSSSDLCKNVSIPVCKLDQPDPAGSKTAHTTGGAGVKVKETPRTATLSSRIRKSGKKFTIKSKFGVKIKTMKAKKRVPMKSFKERVKCIPCQKDFRDNYDYRKHCKSLVHLERHRKVSESLKEESEER